MDSDALDTSSAIHGGTIASLRRSRVLLINRVYPFANWLVDLPGEAGAWIFSQEEDEILVLAEMQAFAG